MMHTLHVHAFLSLVHNRLIIIYINIIFIIIIKLVEYTVTKFREKIIFFSPARHAEDLLYREVEKSNQSERGVPLAG